MVDDQTSTIQRLTEQLSKLTAVHATVRKQSETRRLALHAAADSLEGLARNPNLVGQKFTDALLSVATNARKSAAG
jgi:hypothetical protein